MNFYERYEALCSERGLKPQTPKMQEVAGVTSGAISGWKRGSLPKGDVICRLAEFFDVSTDYLLCLTELRNYTPAPPVIVPSLTPQEQALIDAFRAVPADGQLRIIQFCLNERDAALKKTQGAKIV